MRLFEAIVDANHRALAGDAGAGLHLDEFADSLPVTSLTCIDPRLNSLFPEVIGVTKENFIWLRNAGNIITGPVSSTMRSLALACAIKGAKEIAIIGHNDCQVCKTSTMKLIEAFRSAGVERSALPDNLTDFFGMFASEPQNVMKAVDFVRHSPLIGPKIPVHGLMVDITTGKLEWVVNGYQALESSVSPFPAENVAQESMDALKSLAAFKIGEMKFPDTKIGELETQAKNWLAKELEVKKPVEPAPLPPMAAAPAASNPPQPRIPPPVPDFPIPPPFRTRPRVPNSRKF